MQIQAMHFLVMIKYIPKCLIYELGSHALARQKRARGHLGHPHPMRFFDVGGEMESNGLEYPRGYPLQDYYKVVAVSQVESSLNKWPFSKICISLISGLDKVAPREPRGPTQGVWGSVCAP